MLKRIDPEDPQLASGTLKEAVCESLLNNLYNSVSGSGNVRKTVTNERPSKRFVSGFLEAYGLAKRCTFSSDENANPIHIISLGLDFVTTPGLTVIKIKPSFSVYVRRLPTTEDLLAHKTHLELSSSAKTQLREMKKAAGERYDLENSSLKEDNLEKFYSDRRKSIQLVVEEFIRSNVGVDPQSQDRTQTDADKKEQIESESRLLSEGEDLDVTENELDNERQKNNEDISENISFVIYPNMPETISPQILKDVRPIQKWHRIDFHNLPSSEVILGSPDQKSMLAAYSIELNQIVKNTLIEWLSNEDPEAGGHLWAYPRNLRVNSIQIKNWEASLKELRSLHHETNDPSNFAIPEIDLRITIDRSARTESDGSISNRISFENRADTNDWNSVEHEEAIFQTHISVELPIAQHYSISLDRIKPSYRYQEYMRYNAIGYNSGVVSQLSDEKLLLTTTWMPLYRQPRIRSLQYEDVCLKFDVLAGANGLESLSSLTNIFSDWIEKIKSTIDPRKGSLNESQANLEEEKFHHDCQLWAKENEQIGRGISLLEDSAAAFASDPLSTRSAPFRAWVLMNESMGLSAKRKGFDSWRLFQLAFILANICGLSSRMEEFTEYYDETWDESVALLYFATGGGKTESFFGLLIFNLFLDRIRGKEFGVTAMMRYPLRLLTIQQAQRLAKSLADAERTRWKYDIGGEPFAIGFWVGGANTPNRKAAITKEQVPSISKVDISQEQSIRSLPEYVYAIESWNKLPSCPFCGAQTGLRRFPDINGLIGHVCTATGEKCAWNKNSKGAQIQPLPFYIVDDDIYEKAPAVVLGTIDKLALLGQSPTTIRRFMGMFGLAPKELIDCGHLEPYIAPNQIETMEGEPIYPAYHSGRRKFFDPFPSLIIQDEAHLLEESLGTFSGVFETTFEKMLLQLGDLPKLRELVVRSKITDLPRMPKIVAATATVSEPERQMENLYQRRVNQFPRPGPSLYDSFYAAPSVPTIGARTRIDEIEYRAHTARFYVSILTNGAPHTTVAVELLGHFHTLISSFLSRLNSGDNTQIESTREQLISGVEGSIVAADYIPALRAASPESLATLIDLHRISLTYVTNKKGGDQIMAAENDATARIHETAGIAGFASLNSELISGAVSAGEIENVISRAESRPAPGEEFSDILLSAPLRSVVATSAISHGVDVDEFNSMFFAGMPSDPSEYIQASSRVGRKHVGFSVLIPTPQRRRDRYILETHDQYHRFLERMIRPAAVNRWAENALIRALPSIVQAYLIGVLEPSEMIALPDSDKSSARTYDNLNRLSSVINAKGQVHFRRELYEFVHDSVGLNHPEFSPPAAKEFKLILEQHLREFLNFLKQNSDLLGITNVFKEFDRSNPKYKALPMTSLRDVDPAGNLRYVKKASSSVSSETAFEIMKIVRKGRS